MRAHGSLKCLIVVDSTTVDVHSSSIDVDPAALKQQRARVMNTQELQWRIGTFRNGLETFSSSKPTDVRAHPILKCFIVVDGTADYVHNSLFDENTSAL